MKHYLCHVSICPEILVRYQDIELYSLPPYLSEAYSLLGLYMPYEAKNLSIYWAKQAWHAPEAKLLCLYNRSEASSFASLYIAIAHEYWLRFFSIEPKSSFSL